MLEFGVLVLLRCSGILFIITCNFARGSEACTSTMTNKNEVAQDKDLGLGMKTAKNDDRREPTSFRSQFLGPLYRG